MKITWKFFLTTCLFICVGIFSFVACEEKEDKKLSAYDDVLETTTTSCDCEDDWFPHSQTPAPEEGIGSPFDTSSTTNCMFQQWAWQKFLWLTKPEGANPLFLDSLIQVTSKMSVVPQQTGAALVLTDTAQAGPGAILKTNPAYNSSGEPVTVHYSIHINETLQTSANSYLTQLLSGSLPATNDSVFPIGSLELKLAWVDVTAIPSANLGNYFTTTAALLQPDGTTYVNTEVALLGMHIVGVVINHPEFIWATFEHNSMAPTFDWVNETVSSSEETLLFATASATSSIDGIRWNSGSSAPYTANQAFELFEYGIPLNSGGGYMLTSQEEPKNYNNIDSLNICAVANLVSENDVWQNYFYNGAIWINTDGLNPTKQADTIRVLSNTLKDADSGAIARGSLNAANLAMETFTQTFNSTAASIDVSSLVNCFSCHNSKLSDTALSPLYLSHIFRDTLQAAQGASDEEIIRAKRSLFSKNKLYHSLKK